MYIIYRSRFQPEFTKIHKKAVDKFFVIKEEIQEESEFVLGIVDENLFMKLYDEEKMKKEIDGILRDYIGDDVDDYKRRLSNELNPTSVGLIKKSVWNNWPLLKEHGPVPYTIVCNAAWTGLSLYELASKNTSGYVVRWLPESTPEHIGWYFPIFDRDDVNDMGLIAMLMKACKLSDENRIFFVRFNYNNRPTDFQYHDTGYQYGAYLAMIAKKQQNFEITANRSAFTGMQVLQTDSVPLIYLWSEAVKILDKFKEMLNWCLQTTGKIDSQCVSQIIKEIEDGLVKRIKDSKSRYAGDLEEFFRFIGNLPTRLENCHLEADLLDKVRKLVETVKKQHPINKDNWLETNFDSRQRVDEIVKEIDKIKKGE